MKYTETSMGECIKADVLYRRILWRLNLIGRQIHESKKKFTCFYTHAQKKSDVSAGEKNENSVSWVEAFDDFAENWEEIDEIKDEIDWAIRNMFASVEREEKQQMKKAEKDKY